MGIENVIKGEERGVQTLPLIYPRKIRVLRTKGTVVPDRDVYEIATYEPKGKYYKPSHYEEIGDEK